MDTVQVEFDLQCRVRQDSDSRWISWCPLLDVYSQGESKDEAKRCLREAIGLWVESCLERGTLDAALEELGFAKIRRDGLRPGEQRFAAQPVADTLGATFSLHLSIPAYQAA